MYEIGSSRCPPDSSCAGRDIACVVIGAMPPGATPPIDAIWTLPVPSESAAAAVFDDGMTFEERAAHDDGVPQLLTYMGASPLRRVAQCWEVAPLHPGFEGAIDMRWEFGQRTTRKALYDLLQKGCERAVADTTIHQPVKTGPPEWRKSIAGCHHMKRPKPNWDNGRKVPTSQQLESSCRIS